MILKYSCLYSIAISDFSPNLEEEEAFSTRTASLAFDYKVFQLRESCDANYKEILTKSIDTNETLYDWLVEKILNHNWLLLYYLARSLKHQLHFSIKYLILLTMNLGLCCHLLCSAAPQQ
jgi:hypothetical protein